MGHEAGTVDKVSGRPGGIVQRLGWLRVVEIMQGEVEKIKAFAQEIVIEGFSHVALIGMGGSSLAPEVFTRVSRPVEPVST